MSKPLRACPVCPGCGSKKFKRIRKIEGHVLVRGEFGLDLCTKFGKVTVRPGQWIVNAGNGNIHVLDPDVFHAEYEAVIGA